MTEVDAHLGCLGPRPRGHGACMTTASTARRGAQRAADSGPLVGLTRMGFVGYGLLHLAIAWLAVQIALGRAANEGDQSGALRTLADQPFGKVLLWLIVVGLCAMAIWQLLLAAIGHRDKQGTSRTWERAASAARAVVYAALAFTAGKVVTGAATSSAGQQKKATAGIMAQPAGPWLVGMAGIIVVAVGVGLIVYGWKRTFLGKLATGRMSPPFPATRRAARPVRLRGQRRRVRDRRSTPGGRRGDPQRGQIPWSRRGAARCRPSTVRSVPPDRGRCRIRRLRRLLLLPVPVPQGRVLTSRHGLPSRARRRLAVGRKTSRRQIGAD